MELTRDRAVGYLRALASGLHTLAPNDDFVPLDEALSHLHALSPELSRGFLLPAQIDPASGLPALAWLMRARAEQTLALRTPDLDEEEVERAQILDPELGDRMAGRLDLHRFLREAALLPSTRLHGALRRRRGKGVDVVLVFDRLDPDGTWLRIKLDLKGAPTRGPVSVRSDGIVSIDQSVLHLLVRGSALPLTGLHAHLQSGLGHLTRISRGRVGPFWFPGVRLPARVPEALGGGLVLNLGLEVLAEEIKHPSHGDPMFAPEPAPEGFGLFRSRRFAAAPAQTDAVVAWCREREVDPLVELLRPRAVLG